jgi:DNA-binding response OmpR family regulator
MAFIAIIDDDPDIVEATGLILQARGHSTASASTADEGYALVTQQHPDLIILDVMMLEPDDGFFLANKLRKAGVTTPIVMLTSVAKAVGYTFGSHEMVPTDAFLEKPVTPARLVDTVETLLQTEKV